MCAPYSPLAVSIPKGKFRVLQFGPEIKQVGDDLDAPEKAFAIAAERNRALGVDEVFRAPCLVFGDKGDLVYGPDELCPELLRLDLTRLA